MTDIVERLRYAHTRNLPLDDGLMGEAAAEIERLRTDRDVWRNESIKKQAACEQMGARIMALEAERDRMEDALRDIMDRFDLEDCELTQDARTARDIARAALKEINDD